MPFQAHELTEIERAVTAFMQRRRPPEAIRKELDLEHRIDGQSLEILERRPAWRGAPSETTERPVARGAPAAEAAIRRVAVRQWLGLTATPYRADHMDAIITMQCGPIRHVMAQAESHGRELIVHDTPFETHEPGTDGPSIQAIYNEIASDASRNRQICRDVARAHEAGRNCLVLFNGWTTSSDSSTFSVLPMYMRSSCMAGSGPKNAAPCAPSSRASTARRH